MNRIIASAKAGTLSQVAALPIRVGNDGVCRVMLLTSRETKRWVIPKGWPMKGKTDCEAAAQEALEEAGLIGEISAEPIGRFDYFKRREAHFDLCHVEVFLLTVARQRKRWREQRQRQAKWFTLGEAATLVEEPGLAAIFKKLADSGPVSALS